MWVKVLGYSQVAKSLAAHTSIHVDKVHCAKVENLTQIKPTILYGNPVHPCVDFRRDLFMSVSAGSSGEGCVGDVRFGRARFGRHYM